MTEIVVDQQATTVGRPRRRLPADWDVDDFINWANANEIRYVVLRWFETLPDLRDGEDIDILVADDSVEQVLSVVQGRRTEGIPCDVYSASGRLGTKYKGVPYYPPHLANEILDNAERYQDRIPVPSRKHYFYSLAYHAVFHKGRRSDLHKSSEERRESETGTSTHSHFHTLCRLRDELGIDVSVNFSSLAEFLREQSWEPGLDLMRKLGESNGWVKQLYEKRASKSNLISGLSVFVLRNWAVRKGWAPTLIVRLQQLGFVVLMVHELTGDRHDVARRHLRGGNWGTSREFPVNSGGPAMLIVLLDPAPKPIRKRDRRQYPHMSNGRVIDAKRELRQMMNQKRRRDALINSLHTSDDEAEALYYIELIVPETVPALRKAANAVLRAHRSRGPAAVARRVARRVLPARARVPVRRGLRRLGLGALVR